MHFSFSKDPENLPLYLPSTGYQWSGNQQPPPSLSIIRWIRQEAGRAKCKCVFMGRWGGGGSGGACGMVNSWFLGPPSKKNFPDCCSVHAIDGRLQQVTSTPVVSVSVLKVTAGLFLARAHVVCRIFVGQSIREDVFHGPRGGTPQWLLLSPCWADSPRLCIH